MLIIASLLALSWRHPAANKQKRRAGLFCKPLPFFHALLLERKSPVGDPPRLVGEPIGGTTTPLLGSVINKDLTAQ